MNPLLDFSALPRFDLIEPAHVSPAIQQLLAESRSLLEQMERDDVAASWQDFVVPLGNADERLWRTWGIVQHMHGVKDEPPWRAAYNAMLPEVSGFSAEQRQNPLLINKYRALRDADDFAALNPTRQHIVEQDIRNLRLSGAELPADKKPRFKQISEELDALAAKFSENLLDATNAHAEWIASEEELAGLPADVKAAAAAAAAQEGRSGWKLSLHAPSYLPVMQYADNRQLRQRMYRAYATRASEQGPAQWDNGPLIEKILALRQEAAELLGFANYAEVSLAPKMADSPQQVEDFLRDLVRRARPSAEHDLAELREFAREILGLEQLETWDITWAAEKLKQARYAFSDDEVKQYFPEHKVLEGLFQVVETLFAVRIEAAQAPLWHPQVRYFRIFRQQQEIASFYLDLYARETKRGGAWMADAISRRALEGDAVQRPLAYLCCNFPAPLGDRPATFSHDDVITLFHETGHGLHHLLTEVDEIAASGISGVEWDAVELPSQFLENFCWDWQVLSALSAHVDTGEALPRALYDKMIAAKNFHSGMVMLRQLEFGLFDLLLHSEIGDSAGFMQLLEQVRKEVAVIFPPNWGRFPHAFSHIFAGGYAAGYYSYMWAQVLSADAYSAFEEAAEQAGSLLDAQTGQRFHREILAVGGSRPALESFKAFRGREPTADALLRHNGIVTTDA